VKRKVALDLGAEEVLILLVGSDFRASECNLRKTCTLEDFLIHQPVNLAPVIVPHVVEDVQRGGFYAHLKPGVSESAGSELSYT
jgi:hypothetical protein